MPHNFHETNFAGDDYDPARDLQRMADGMGSVFAVMMRSPDVWYKLETLSELSGVPQSSVGSYLSYLRRDFGYSVPKEHLGNGLYQYKLGVRGEPSVAKKKATNDNAAALEMCQILWDALKLNRDGGAVINLAPLDLSVIEQLASRAGVNKGG